jgi:threonine dehydratase
MIDHRRHIPIDAIRDAAAALGAMDGGAVRTPLVRVELPVCAGAPRDLDLYLKLEVFQPIGAFKIRGALNVVRQLTSEQLASGVWTVSAGNAALGVACRAAGRRALFVMVFRYGAAGKAGGYRAAFGAAIVMASYRRMLARSNTRPTA